MPETIITKKWRFVVLVQTLAMLECLKADHDMKPLFQRQLITLKAIDAACQVDEKNLPDDLPVAAANFVGMFYGSETVGWCPVWLVPKGAKPFKEVEKDLERVEGGPDA